MFVKQQRKSLFVYFQGHLEYEAQSLLGEYRRDIGRFLRREIEYYPTMPKGYFDDQTAELLTAFQKHALLDRRNELLADFPVDRAAIEFEENLASGGYTHLPQLDIVSVGTKFSAEQTTCGRFGRHPLRLVAGSSNSMGSRVSARKLCTLVSAQRRPYLFTSGTRSGQFPGRQRIVPVNWLGHEHVDLGPLGI